MGAAGVTASARIATYRLQLNAQFGFARARGVLPYLRGLGVSHVYCSPVLAARPGSSHGYDVVDPRRLNPALGTDGEWRDFSAAVHGHGMKLLLDIVPNHMATGEHNPYWEDVLTHGRRSRYAPWFDIDWRHRGGRVVLPVLVDALPEVIARGELEVIERGGAPRLRYLDSTFPLAPGTAGGDVAAMLEAQHYRLIHWRAAPSAMNYRRFFDVNDLVALRVEDADVFRETHATVIEWVRAGLVDALRIDHVDGLQDPAGYLRLLRAEVGDGCDIWVEKILLGDEALPAWPVQGTTGYESIGEVEDMLVDPDGFARIEAGYRRLRSARPHGGFEQEAVECRQLVLRGALRPDVMRVTRLLAAASRESGADRPPARRALATALSATIACMDVYRTYATGAPDADDRRRLTSALERAAALGLAAPRELAAIHAVFERAATSARARRFVHAFQQVTGPAMAKGVEDTALYRWIPLASRNEVGGNPARPLEGAITRFHERNRERLARWPDALRASSTHDTKRSADARARIHVLAQIPDEWLRLARRWRAGHHALRVPIPGLNRRTAPDANAEYLLYQTLVALWPAGEPSGLEEIAARAAEYLLKATREAKERTSWTAGDPRFEDGLRAFVRVLVLGAAGSAFREELRALVARIAPHAEALAMTRELLRCASPGVPDIYQGDERWSVTLVDPDNRRPVDFVGDAVDRKEQLVRALLRVRREHGITLTSGGYIPLETGGDRAIAFAREAEDGRHVIAIGARLTLSRGRDPGDAMIPVPARVAVARWRCALSGRVVCMGANSSGRGEGVLRLADALAADPVALLIALPGGCP